MLFDNAFDWLATKRSKFHLLPGRNASHGDDEVVKSNFLTTRLQRLVADKLAPNFVCVCVCLVRKNGLIFLTEISFSTNRENCFAYQHVTTHPMLQLFHSFHRLWRFEFLKKKFISLKMQLGRVAGSCSVCVEGVGGRGMKGGEGGGRDFHRIRGLSHSSAESRQMLILPHQ